MHSVIKLFMCLMLLFGTVLVPKQQKVEAALPLAAWAVGALGSIVTDVAIDAGIDFVDDVAKNKWKDKKVGEIWSKYGDTIKNLKPTKKNAKEWALKVPKWLMAAIVDEVGDTIEDTVEKDVKRKDTNKKGFEKSSLDVDSVDPLYNTGIAVNVGMNMSDENTRKASAYYMEWFDYYIVPVAYGQASTLYICDDGKNYSEKDCAYREFDGGETIYVSGHVFNSKPSPAYSTQSFTNSSGFNNNTVTQSRYSAFLKSLKLLEDKNKTVYYADGVLATKGSESVFNLPDTIYDGQENKQVVYSPDSLQKLDEKKYPMIAEREYTFNLGDGSDIIDADFEVIEEGDEFDWEIVEKDIEQNISNYNKTINYDYEPVINNYYTVSDPNEIKNDIEIIIKNEIDNGSVSGGATGKIDVDIEGPFYCVDQKSKQIVSCKEIEAIDGGLLEYIGNAYDYAVNAVKSAVDGLNTIVAGSAGLMTLYSHIFGWLPDEMTVILTSGLLLMIGLRVFRK